MYKMNTISSIRIFQMIKGVFRQKQNLNSLCRILWQKEEDFIIFRTL